MSTMIPQTRSAPGGCALSAHFSSADLEDDCPKYQNIKIKIYQYQNIKLSKYQALTLKTIVQNIKPASRKYHVLQGGIGLDAFEENKTL